MNISLVTNTFQKYHRQNLAIDSYLAIKKHFPYIKLINFQFLDEKDIFKYHYEGIETDHSLTLSSKGFSEISEKKLPVFSEIIENAFNKDAPDYVIYTNSDVILLPRLIERILKDTPDCMAGPRLEIDNIDSFEDVLQNKVKPIRVEIAGYDYFVFKKEWYFKYRNYLLNNFVIGKPFFDVVYAGLMVLFGENFIIDNDFPLSALHIAHGNSAVTHECFEKKHNHDIMKNNIIYQIAINVIHYNLQHNLCKRKPWGYFIEKTPDEQQNQKTFFETMNIHKDNSIYYIE
jgi:hypothetical protein